MLYISIVMGALVGYLTDVWLLRAGVQDQLRLILAVVAFVLVAILTYVGLLPHF